MRRFRKELALQHVFTKFDTGDPSIASAEILSTGKDVLRVKRATLSDAKLESLVLVKGYRLLAGEKSCASGTPDVPMVSVQLVSAVLVGLVAVPLSWRVQFVSESVSDMCKIHNILMRFLFVVVTE